MVLLDLVKYDAEVDRLLFVGDLVNRGPKSLEVLRFVKSLKIKPVITLGNHDLYLLYRIFVKKSQGQAGDTIDDILTAPDSLALGNWLKEQTLLYHSKSLNILITHAGLPPVWTLDDAKMYAREVEEVLRGENYLDFLNNMFGHEPKNWENDLKGWDRLRCLTNYLTRMRFCDARGALSLAYKGNLKGASPDLIPWYAHPLFKPIKETIIFGHWASLGLVNPAPNIYALDSGCVWGEKLTALRIEDKKIFLVGAQG